MVEGVDGLVCAGDRVIVGDVKLRVFLDYGLVPHDGSGAADQLGRTHPEQGLDPAAFMSGLPAAPARPHHDRHLLGLQPVWLC